MLILASASPRRKDLLSRMDIQLQVIPSEAPEVSMEKNPIKLVKNLAKVKAQWVQQRNKNKWILGADTLVFYNRKVLGKPADRQEAMIMLQHLQGKVHQVRTGYALYNPEKNRWITGSACTKVKFRNLSKKEIHWYLEKQEWIDAAGGYKIQGAAGAFVQWIKGSYSNVVGLPLEHIYGIFINANFPMEEAETPTL